MYLGIFSILVGLAAGYAFTTKQASIWIAQRNLVWAMTAIAVLSTIVGGFIFGAEIMLAGVAFLGVTVYGSFKNDAVFSGLATKNSVEIGRLFVGFAREEGNKLINRLVDRTMVRKPDVVTEPRRPASAPVSAPAPQAAPKQDAPVAPVATIERGEEEVLQELLVEIGRLQQWTARPEAERASLSQLSADVRNTEAALNEAVLQLKTGTVNWNKIVEHVDGLKQHDLPETLTQSLDSLVAERAGKLEDTRKTVGEVSDKLRQSSGQLKAELDKPVLSPEDVIDSANEAIEAADAISADARKQQAS
jgi:hypothetical protein